MEKQIKKIIVTWAPPIYHYYYMFCPRVFMCFTPGQGCKLETRTHDHEFGFWSLYPLGHHGEWQKITFGRGIYVFLCVSVCVCVRISMCVCCCICSCTMNVLAYLRVRLRIHPRLNVYVCVFLYVRWRLRIHVQIEVHVRMCM